MLRIFKRVSAQELVDFAKNLSVMLKSGMAINESLAALAQQAKPRSFAGVLEKTRKEVEMGMSLSEALTKEKKIFGGIFISMTRAGEASGTLEENLTFLASWLERNNDLRKQINNAMFYPKIVFTATFVLAGALAVFILPKLVPLFNQLRMELPLPTRILLAFASFVDKYWALAILAAVGIFILFKLLNHLRSTKRFFHLIYLRMPFLGRLMVDYQLALISQLFATLFKSGLSVNDILNLVSSASTNIYYSDSLKTTKEKVASGISISESIMHYPKLYPQNFLSILQVGEKSGTLIESFNYLADFYSKEVDSKTKRLPLVIEPALLIFIGLMVGFVAFSIIMPIYSSLRAF